MAFKKNTSFKSPSSRGSISVQEPVELVPKKKRFPKVIAIYGDNIAILKKRRTDEICKKCRKVIQKGTELVAIQEFIYHFRMPYADKRGWYFHKECGSPERVDEFPYEPTKEAERVIQLLSGIYNPSPIEKSIIQKLSSSHIYLIPEEEKHLIYLWETMVKEKQTFLDVQILEKLRKHIPI